MRRNCNLELRLVPPSVSLCSGDFEDKHHQPDTPMLDLLSEVSKDKEQQQLTIFYNGKVCVCDVTELQARAVILLASRTMEENLKTPTDSEPSSPLLPSQLYSPMGLSMKRSLQRFLQKRNHRIQATSPYHR